jgi:hypothetical protein
LVSHGPGPEVIKLFFSLNTLSLSLRSKENIQNVREFCSADVITLFSPLDLKFFPAKGGPELPYKNVPYVRER